MAPLDAILIPGDLSIDDYDSRCLPRNYCYGIKKDYLDRLPAPYHVIPGNHDSYPDVLWKKIFGTSRQLLAVIGGCLFLMADTYNSTPARDASGSPYTPVDTAWVERELNAHPGMPAFLLAHYFHPKAEGETFSSSLSAHPHIRALFMGHTHRFQVHPPCEAYGNKPLFDIGAFSYYTCPTDGKWDFNIFHPEWRWGYQLLEFDDESFSSWHVFPAMEYHSHNGDFTFDEEITEKQTYPLYEGK